MSIVCSAYIVMKLELNLMSFAADFLVDTEVSCSYFGMLCGWCVVMEFELVVHVIKKNVGVWGTSAAS
jgi:hypothetical protein